MPARKRKRRISVVMQRHEDRDLGQRAQPLVEPDFTGLKKAVGAEFEFCDHPEREPGRKHAQAGGDEAIAHLQGSKRHFGLSLRDRRLGVEHHRDRLPLGRLHRDVRTVDALDCPHGLVDVPFVGADRGGHDEGGRQQDREKLKQVEANPQMDLFG